MDSRQRQVVAAVLAGGIGARVGGEQPKQLLQVAGRPLMAHAVQVFEDHPDVDAIVLVMHPDHLDAGRAVAAGFSKVTAVLPGGSSRSDSSRVALAEVGDDDAVILLHDAARPLVTSRMVDDCLAALVDHDAVGTAVESADTIWQLDPSGQLAAVPSRDTLRRVQTPQGFRVGALRAAYAEADRDPDFAVTDDCAVVFRYTPAVRVAVVAGDDRNLKVTTPTDVALAEGLLTRP